MITFFFIKNKYRGNPEEISKLETFKACQYIDIPTNFIKKTAGKFFQTFIILSKNLFYTLPKNCKNSTCI